MEILEKDCLWKKAVDICRIFRKNNSLIKEEYLSIEEIAKRLQTYQTDANFRKVLNFIHKNDFCKIKYMGDQPKRYYCVNYKKLATFLMKGNLFKEYFEEIVKIRNPIGGTIY